MQESIYDERQKSMQFELNQQIDEINQIKQAEVESLKGKYAELFNEKAQELENLRQNYDTSEQKNQQQSRTISDMEFKMQELSTLLDKKQKCHHREFERNYAQMETEIEILKVISNQSQAELKIMEKKFAQIQAKFSHNSDDSGLQNSSSSLENSQENHSKKRRGKKKRR